MTRRIDRALVTGASAGIGRALAIALSRRDVEVVLVARRADRLERLVAELPVACEVLAADLVDPGSRRRVAERLASAEAPVDLLVNSAGVGAYGPFHELGGARQARLVELNCAALIELTRAVLPQLVARRRGGVINLGSTAGLRPGPYGAVYGATKAFVRSFTEAVHEEQRGSGVHVMLAAPGVTPTEFRQVAGSALRWLPRALTTSADEVAETILRDFARGKAVSVPGALPRALSLVADVTPSAVSRRVAGAVLARAPGVGPP